MARRRHRKKPDAMVRHNLNIPTSVRDAFLGFADEVNLSPNAFFIAWIRRLISGVPDPWYDEQVRVATLLHEISDIRAAALTSTDDIHTTASRTHDAAHEIKSTTAHASDLTLDLHRLHRPTSRQAPDSP